MLLDKRELEVLCPEFLDNSFMHDVNDNIDTALYYMELKSRIPESVKKSDNSFSSKVKVA